MLTWAIAWMSVQMARAGKEIDSVAILLYMAIIADAVALSFIGWMIFK